MNDAPFLELSEDEMVELLSYLQRISRDMLVKAKGIAGKDYNASEHEKAVQLILDKLKWLANSGDVM